MRRNYALESYILDRKTIISGLYNGTITDDTIAYDQMTAPPITSFIPLDAIAQIKKISTSSRYAGNGPLKRKMIKEIMEFCGFKEIAGGTNRAVFEHPNANGLVFKIARDIDGINDNYNEYNNQELLKPYCTKIFECTPCGTVVSCEKVEAFKHYHQMYCVVPYVLEIIKYLLSKGYIVADIGIDKFMNYGLRPGFGPVLLDFTYIYELDEDKLDCRRVLDDGSICGGDIGYDVSYDNIICEKCGKKYTAIELAKAHKTTYGKFLKSGGIRMKVRCLRGGKVEREIDIDCVSPVYKKEAKKQKKSNELVVRCIKVPVMVEKIVTETEVPVKKETVNDPKIKIRNKILKVDLNSAINGINTETNKVIKVSLPKKKVEEESVDTQEKIEEVVTEEVAAVEAPSCDMSDTPIENDLEEEVIIEVESKEEDDEIAKQAFAEVKEDPVVEEAKEEVADTVYTDSEIAETAFSSLFKGMNNTEEAEPVLKKKSKDKTKKTSNKEKKSKSKETIDEIETKEQIQQELEEKGVTIEEIEEKAKEPEIPTPEVVKEDPVVDETPAEPVRDSKGRFVKGTASKGLTRKGGKASLS